MNGISGIAARVPSWFNGGGGPSICGGGILNGGGPRLVIVLKLAGHLNTRRASNSLFEIVYANDTTYELLCFLIVQSYEFLLSYEFLFFLIVLFALLLVLLLHSSFQLAYIHFFF